jgi:predicted GNAT family acetyltransferase
VHVRRLDDPARFLAEAGPLLLEDEARHNLILGIAHTLRANAGVYPEFSLWLVETAGRVVLAALRTPPYNLTLARPFDPRAVPELARALEIDDPALPGVTAAVPEAHRFAGEWARVTGVALRHRTRQRIYSATRISRVPEVAGEPRPATKRDRSLLVQWLTAFAGEALPADTPGRGAEAVVAARFDRGVGGFVIWEVGGPVSVAGWGGRTPNGVRIGPVYTPPEFRRHGYGSAVTAAVSLERIAAGCRFCFLYTDLSNPTSNRIYTAIGYEPVCDSVDYAFDPA